MKLLIRFIAATALVFTGLAEAQIYKSVDANGVVTFSDTPPNDAQTQVEKIQTPARVNGMQEIPITPIEAEQRDTGEGNAERTVGIISPVDNTMIPMGAGIFDVVVDITPALGNGDSIELYLDEENMGEPGAALTWTLTYVTRGAHKLQAKWVAEDGSIVATSETITVFVLRPSIL